MSSRYKSTRTSLRFLRITLIAFSLFTVTGKTLAADAIPDQFDTYWTGAADAFDHFKACLPAVSETVFKSDVANLGDNKLAKIVTNNAFKKTDYVLAQNDTFVCVHLNSRKKPIIPISFFYGTIAFSSQTAEERKTLYGDLARQISQDGFAQALIIMDNGNAVHIAYMNESDDPARIYYNSSFLKPGEYNEQDYKPIYHIKTSPVNITVFDNHGNSKSLIQDVMAARPQKDGFLVIPGTSQTGQFAFEGSKWVAKSGGMIALGTEGKLTFQPNNGKEIKGDWKVEDNVLYFHYGNVYCSSTLNSDNDELSVESRFPMPAFVSDSRQMGEFAPKEQHLKAKWLLSDSRRNPRNM